ncbi:MAG: DMT family transporter [Succinivibrionaceae bacterium]|nr:DMT family transporter [Succinivibrionaceae bacterium]
MLGFSAPSRGTGRCVALIMLSSLCFALLNVVVKHLCGSWGTGQVAFMRGLFSTVMVAAIMLATHQGLSRHDIPTLTLRGVLGGCGMLLIFYALSGMPMGDVSILTQLSSFFVIIFAALFLHERLRASILPKLAIIVAGACVILQPWNFSSFNIYACFALGNAIFSAAAMTTISTLAHSGRHNSYEIVLYFLVCATIAGAIAMGGDFTMPTPTQFLLCLLMGALTVLAQVTMTLGYAAASPVVASFCQYSGVFFNVLLGFAFFGERLGADSLLGGILIVGGSMLLTRDRHRKAGGS